jgi:hypothetical protein
VPSEETGPSAMPCLVVEHGSAPCRQMSRRDQACDMSPVLEQDAAAVDESFERRPPIRTEPAPQGEVMRAVHHVDGIELDAPGILGEADEARRGQPAGARADEVLALEEERGDGAA